MTVKIRTNVFAEKDIYETPETIQAHAWLYWRSRGKWYCVSQITITHNEEYPTPAINISEPSPGIRFTVTDQDGNTLYSSVKPKEEGK